MEEDRWGQPGIFMVILLILELVGGGYVVSVCLKEIVVVFDFCGRIMCLLNVWWRHLRFL